ncbi:DUF3310 domain-containing protein (plasmid) [Streptomyces sp. BI20]|uniref:DUF3310 domain-containing protein n=1 Tax=Streptomyces sp. BI20 TaxID=3403460 RepID=UPI003C715148
MAKQPYPVDTRVKLSPAGAQVFPVLKEQEGVVTSTYGNEFGKTVYDVEFGGDTLTVVTVMPDEIRALAEAGDAVNHPAHYAVGWSNGAEVIDLTEHLVFNRGNAVKYLCRAGKKADELEDLRKALWYVNREINRVENVK